LSDEGVSEDDELSHDGGQGDLCFFSLFDEAVIEGLERGVASGGGDGGHVEGAPQVLSSAANVAGAGVVSAVVCDRGEAEEHGGLLGRQGADLDEADDQRSGGEGAQAGNRGDDRPSPGENRIVLDSPFDCGGEIFDGRFGGSDLTFDFEDGRSGVGGAELVAQGGESGDGGVAAVHEFLQFLDRLADRGPGVGLEAFPQDRQNFAVDAVGLGQFAEGLGEQAGAQRIDDGDRKAAGVKTAVGGAMELAGRLHHDAGGGMSRQRSLELSKASRIVADLQPLANRMDINVETVFTDVYADIDWDRASFGRDLSLHAGLAPHHLFRTGAKSERTLTPRRF